MGLNVELERAVARVGSDRVVIVSADLPLLRSSDMDALLRSALAEGSAIAPDRPRVAYALAVPELQAVLDRPHQAPVPTGSCLG